jgi:hypothetical protein
MARRPHLRVNTIATPTAHHLRCVVMFFDTPGPRERGPLEMPCLDLAVSAAAAGARRDASSDQRHADAGEHTHQRGRRHDERQGLVDVAHDRALGADHLDDGRPVVGNGTLLPVCGWML